MQIVVVDLNEHQLNDLKLYTDAKINIFTSIRQLKVYNDDIVLVNHGTRFLTGFPQFGGNKIQVPDLQPMNPHFGEILPLPIFHCGLRPDYQLGRNFSRPYVASSHCVYLPKNVVAELKEMDTIDASIIEVSLRREVWTVGQVQVVNQLPQISQKDADALQEQLPLYPSYGKGSLLELDPITRNTLNLKGIFSQYNVAVCGPFEGLNHKLLKTFDVMVATERSPKSLFQNHIVDVAVTLHWTDIISARHYWSVDGTGNNATKFEPAHQPIYHPYYNPKLPSDDLAPPFVCSSSEILAVHLLAYAGSKSITLFGDFNNIPMFWESIEVIKKHVPIIKIGLI